MKNLTNYSAEQIVTACHGLIFRSVDGTQFKIGTRFEENRIELHYNLSKIFFTVSAIVDGCIESDRLIFEKRLDLFFHQPIKSRMRLIMEDYARR